MAQRTTTPSGGRSNRGRAAYVAVAAFLLGLAAGGVHRGGSSPDERVAAASSSDTTPVAAAAAPRRGAVPGGFARSTVGAVAAATGYVTTGQLLLDVDPLAAEAAVRQMASTATADAQVADTLAKLAAARAALSEGTGPIRFTQAALAWRLDSYTQRRARVAVWSVGVLSRLDVAPPQASWSTSTLDLVWETGDWRIRSETITPGPAPMLDASAAPATSAELETALTEFNGFHGAR